MSATQLAHSTCAGTPLVTYFETQCLDLPAYGSSALPESEWLSDILEQVC